MRPGEGWTLYDGLQLEPNALISKANFITQRGENSDNLSVTLRNTSNSEAMSVYDSELDYYTNASDEEDLSAYDDEYDPENEGGYDQEEEYQEEIHGRSGWRGDDQASGYRSEHGIEHNSQAGESYHTDNGYYARGRGGEAHQGAYRSNSRAPTNVTANTVSNNAPAPAVVDMINTWAPAVSKFGGEVRISRFGSAIIKFEPGKDRLG
ncbi:hypothetical protein ABW20_dc0106469 [Dactylellina cionopaga]|nr:hypothetical protein ABW20_dc0106469 [Dactylellina cionopaga]